MHPIEDILSEELRFGKDFVRFMLETYENNEFQTVQDAEKI